MRMLKKMTMDPKDNVLTLEDARALRAGTFHEENDDGDDDVAAEEDTGVKQNYFSRNDKFGAKNIDFEIAVSNILTKPVV